MIDYFLKTHPFRLKISCFITAGSLMRFTIPAIQQRGTMNRHCIRQITQPVVSKGSAPGALLYRIIVKLSYFLRARRKCLQVGVVQPDERNAVSVERVWPEVVCGVRADCAVTVSHT